jgi:hypothetical protein
MNLTAEQVRHERELFEAWFFGRGISSYATKMFAWDAWLYRASSGPAQPTGDQRD